MVLQVLSSTEMTTLDKVKFQILVHFVDTLQSKDFTNIFLHLKIHIIKSM